LEKFKRLEAHLSVAPGPVTAHPWSRTRPTPHAGHPGCCCSAPPLLGTGRRRSQQHTLIRPWASPTRRPTPLCHQPPITTAFERPTSASVSCTIHEESHRTTPPHELPHRLPLHLQGAHRRGRLRSSYGHATTPTRNARAH
jgi:hypothetical protein